MIPYLSGNAEVGYDKNIPLKLPQELKIESDYFLLEVAKLLFCPPVKKLINCFFQILKPNN